MTKNEIEAFIAVVQFGTISSAARELFITQPALSRRIHNLETELGYDLFVRDKGRREISLTPRGHAFCVVARKWNMVYREAEAIRDMDQKPTLRIAMIGSVGHHVLPKLLQQLASGENRFNLDFHMCHSWEAYNMVNDGFADLALIDYLKHSGNQLTGRVISLPIYSTPFVFVGGPAWKNAGAVHPASLDPAKEISLPWNTQFDQWHSSWFDSRIQPRVRSDHSVVIRHLIQEDLYAIVPKTEGIAIVNENPLVSIHELENGPPDEIIHCLTTIENRTKAEVDCFMQMLRVYLRTREDIHSYL